MTVKGRKCPFSSLSLFSLLNICMSRTGLRPHTWKVQGEVPHRQYCCWLQMRAQAQYRGEQFLLTFEDFQRLWQQHWDCRGRGSTDYCLTREDPEGAWDIENTRCVERGEHLRRQRLFKSKSRRLANENRKIHT